MKTNSEITHEMIEQSLASLMSYRNGSPEPGWLRSSQISERLGIGGSTTRTYLKRWIDEGKIPPARIYKVNGRQIPHYYVLQNEPER
jgi:hypothetical protein